MISRRYLLGLVCGCGLIERDMRGTGNRPPCQPAEVDRHSRAAVRGLGWGQQPEDATGKDSAIPCDIAARHLYQKFPEPAWTAFSRRPGDFFCDRAMNKVLPAWGPSCA